MARPIRSIAVGYPHHVTQRGNDRRDVFAEEEDHSRYQDWLARYARRYGLDIWAYCLMPNHVHIVAVPRRADALSRTFQLVNMQYAQYFNEKTGSTGHLWQGRYFSCVLDEPHTQAAVRYVETNPVRAGLAATAEAYRWSSAAAHVSGRGDAILSGDCFLTERIRDWRRYLAEDRDSTARSRLVEATWKGRPCGEETFVRTIEDLMGRCLSPRAVGRPRLNRRTDEPSGSLLPET